MGAGTSDRQAGFQRIAGSEAVPTRLRGCVVAIGNFDGVHRGHQSVLAETLDLARKLGAPALALTFEPHPRTAFRPDRPVARLTPAVVKARILYALGLDGVVEQPFDRVFADRSPESFVDDILLRDLDVRHVVTGYDFHFGKGRAGTPAFLKDRAAAARVGVTVVEVHVDEGGQAVSSSRIRDLLAAGDLGQASGLLGYRPLFVADVVGGKRLGRTLGYPTANMALAPDTPLAHGIYAVRFRRQDGALHDGVASFGRRPTVDADGQPLLETYLFDFSGDLYGQTCEVTLFSRLRAEEKFDGLDALVAQMRRDEAEARECLAQVRPLSPLDAELAFRP